MEPTAVVVVAEGTQRALMRLMDALDDHDDVDSVHANFGVPAGVLERATFGFGARGLVGAYSEPPRGG